MEKLKISDNKRYFVKQNDEPFIWLADTNWTMPQRMKWDDADYFMKERKSQGFTVLQIVALDPERDEEMRNPAGEKALINDNLSTPNERYFEYLDWILDKAESYGFYVLLLPVWGQLVVGEDWSGKTYEKTVNEDNAYAYGKWIGERYKDRTNIIWCLGGDRQPIHKDVNYKKVWRNMAEGLAKGVLGKDLTYNEDREAWKDILITYHACHEAETGECSTMSYWTDEEAWIQFIMLQSGHGLKPKNYELVQKEYDRENVMPVWDGEPAYEAMPTSWPITDNFHGTWIVRKRAYWSLFAGSFGHTYGHCTVWCSVSQREVDMISKLSWFDALHSEGAGHIKVLRDFLEAMKLHRFVPCQKMLTKQCEDQERELDRHLQACVDNDDHIACVYFPQNVEEEIDLDAIGASSGDEGSLQMVWFNPRDGKSYLSNGRETEGTEAVDANSNILKVVPPSAGAEEDWILLIAENAEDIKVIAKSYGEAEEDKEVKKVFEW